MLFLAFSCTVPAFPDNQCASLKTIIGVEGLKRQGLAEAEPETRSDSDARAQNNELEARNANNGGSNKMTRERAPVWSLRPADGKLRSDYRLGRETPVRGDSWTAPSH